MFKNHPWGLAPLFFVEMWERLSFYVISGILLLYALDTERGGLGLPAVTANDIVGTYLAFVYATPFLGGLLADRVLGYRRSVLIGGLCMASGLFSLGTPGETWFVLGLCLVCAGNGLFKPNISAMVGNLYETGDARRDAGFSIFYVGINIGSLTAFIAAAWVREYFGWFWTYRMAGCGLLIGVSLLLLFWKGLATADRPPPKRADDVSIARIVGSILLPAVVVGYLGYWLASSYLPRGSSVTPQVCGFLSGMLPVIVFFVRLGAQATPEEKPGLLALLPIYLAGGTFFMVLHLNTTTFTTWAEVETRRHDGNVLDLFGASQDALPSYFRNADADVARPNRDTLVVVDPATARMFGTSRLDAAAVAGVAKSHPELRVVTTVGELPEASPSTDAAAERRGANVYPEGSVTVKETRDSHGAPVVAVDLKQGTPRRARAAFLKSIGGKDVPVLLVDQVVFDDVYRQANAATPTLPVGEYLRVTSPELFQAVNALCVILLTSPLVLLWEWLRSRGRAVGTARKIFVGLVLTVASLLVMAAGGWLTQHGTMKVSAWWLIGTYVLLTAGELCLSPMGLSLVTKLSPKRYVGLMMGGWFCATSFGNKLSGFLGGVRASVEPMTYFLVIAGIVGLVAITIRLLLPWLDRVLTQYKA